MVSAGYVPRTDCARKLLRVTRYENISVATLVVHVRKEIDELKTRLETDEVGSKIYKFE